MEDYRIILRHWFDRGNSVWQCAAIVLASHASSAFFPASSNSLLLLFFQLQYKRDLFYNIDDGVNCLIIICGRPPYCRVLYVLPIHFFVNYIITLLIQYKKVSDSVTGDVSYCRVWCEVCGHYMSFL